MLRIGSRSGCVFEYMAAMMGALMAVVVASLAFVDLQ